MTKIKERNKNRFFYMLPVILSLAWPTVLEQIMQTAVQYIDTAMVGSLGKQATAAVGATGTVSWLVGSTVSAIGVGFLAYISQAMGAGQEDNAKKASGQAVMAVITVGILFTVLTTSLSGVIPVWMQVDVNIRKMASRYFLILYSPMLFRTASIIFGTVLRSVGDTKSPMIAGIFVNIINIVLNFFLIYPTRNAVLFGKSYIIYGAGLGIEGAAMASAAAYTFGGILITVILWKHKTISPKGQRLRPDPAILKPCLRVAVPNMLQRFATSFGYVAFASMINSLGETATAAHTIANTVESAFYIPGYGMQTAAATLSGNACGAKDKKRLSDLAKITVPLVVVLMIISGGLLFIFAPQLMKLFSDDAEVIALGSTVLRMVAVSEPFYGVPIVIEGIMQGAGKTVTPFVFNVLGMWCVRIVGTFICTQLLGYGLIAAWACMIGHNVLLFVLFIVHYATGKWKPKYMN
ncbi:MAG: MATE family efflux transporter [Firmicutes bacterium]|nr:MATE family efflux transporter [[Eubacterium] siraeum]MCM1488336.1 MATE family efflux transporter [Bacillota bacterium]